MLDVWTLRIIGAGGFGLLGWRLGPYVPEFSSDGKQLLPWGIVLALVGIPIGGLVTPYLVLRPWRRCLAYVNSVPGTTLLSAAVGALFGLVFAALISIPFYAIDGWMAWGIPIIVSVTLGAVGLTLGGLRGQDVQAVFPARQPPVHSNGATAQVGRNGKILVDTSVIIDGRIADLAGTGFLEGALVIPRFILDELRHIADSGDPLRRNRGRRGLEVLGRLRRDDHITLDILDVGITNGDEVDSMLVQMARQMHAPILTTDYNLNRVAEFQGVQVLNINELANALKSIVLPGEDMRVNIVQEGKEMGQGVAYLDDGTMVVVEGGKRYINSFHDVTVTRVLQTAAGRIIFAQSKNN